MEQIGQALLFAGLGMVLFTLSFLLFVVGIGILREIWRD